MLLGVEVARMVVHFKVWLVIIVEECGDHGFERGGPCGFGSGSVEVVLAGLKSGSKRGVGGYWVVGWWGRENCYYWKGWFWAWKWVRLVR